MNEIKLHTYPPNADFTDPIRHAAIPCQCRDPTCETTVQITNDGLMTLHHAGKLLSILIPATLASAMLNLIETYTRTYRPPHQAAAEYETLMRTYRSLHMETLADLFPSKWLKPDDLKGKTVRVHIEAVRTEELFNPRTAKPEPKLILTFHKKQKEMILNKTQAYTLAAITGSEEFSKWQGWEIRLKPTTARNRQPTIEIEAVEDTPPTIRTADVSNVAADVGKRANELAAQENPFEEDPVTAGDFEDTEHA